MKLKDTGLTAQDIKDKVNKYMIETYERFDFLAETAEGMYIYDENKTPYLDFYAGIAVNSAGNCNPKVVAAAKDQLDDIMHTFNYPYTIPHSPTATKSTGTKITGFGCRNHIGSRITIYKRPIAPAA